MTASPDEVVAERVAPVIGAISERIHYAEGRRANYASMGGALIAAGIAIFTFAWGAMDQLILRWAATFGSTCMVVVGGLVLLVYGIQTNRYPYTSATTTWKWFYRDALPKGDTFSLSNWSYYTGIGWEKRKTETTAAYVAQLPAFKTKLEGLRDASVNLDQDLEQVFSLHLNEKYKNLFLSHIRTLFNRGLVTIVVATALGTGYGWGRQNQVEALRYYRQQAPAYVQEIWMKTLTPALEKDAQLNLKAVITNTSARSLHIAGLRALDANGWPLPLEIALAKPTDDIPAKGHRTYYATIKGNLAIVRRIRSFSADYQ